MYGYWFRGNPNIKSIKYYWIQRIANEETNQIMARALKNKKATLKNWPGITFVTNTDEAKALLGTCVRSDSLIESY